MSTATIEKSPVTFNDNFDVERVESIVSLRPALLVRLADLGAFSLLGVVRDLENDGPGEHAVTYGIADARQLSRLEERLRASLQTVFDQGIEFESVCRSSRYDGGGRTLIAMRLPWRDPNLKTIPQDMAGLPVSWQAGMAFGVGQMVKRRETTLAMRRQWSLADATSRAAVPGWLTSAALEIVLDSAAWLALPESK